MESKRSSHLRRSAGPSRMNRKSREERATEGNSPRKSPSLEIFSPSTSRCLSPFDRKDRKISLSLPASFRNRQNSRLCSWPSRTSPSTPDFRKDRKFEDNPIASNKFVLPCPFGPRRKTRSLSKDKLADSTLRKFSKLRASRRNVNFQREMIVESEASRPSSSRACSNAKTSPCQSSSL